MESGATTLGSSTVGAGRLVGGETGSGNGSTIGGGGIARFSSVAICLNAFVVSSPKVRNGAMGGIGSFKMAKMSLIDCRRKSFVVDLGNGVCVGKYSNVSAMRVPRVSGM
jgi:hypothetical protein